MVRDWQLRAGERAARRVTAEEGAAEHVESPALRAVLSGGQMIDWNMPPDQVGAPVVPSRLFRRNVV